MRNCIQNIQYNDSQCLDLYLTSRPHAPLVVGIHGGGFHSSNREDGRCKQMGEYLQEQGIHFTSISYPLAPREDRFAKWPETIFAVADAISYLSREGARWNLDVSRLGMMGFSAGCCLANLYMLGGSGLYEHLGYKTTVTVPKALVGFYGPYDLTIREKSKQAPDPEVNKLMSPAHWLKKWTGKEAPPVYHIHGTADKTVLLKQHEQFKKDYLSRGWCFEEKVLPEFHHSFAPFAEAGGQEAVDLRPSILEFFRLHL
ncbi:alpha/beta hydrolase [Kiritimatiellaeota bacterium B1221]|nr:alpha/beta hydrolase [Kiritimatiellaeota bacterium B1221]